MNRRAAMREGKAQWRVIVVGETAISAEGMATIIGRDPRVEVRGKATRYNEAQSLIQRELPEIIVIEPFLEHRDGILWIKELRTRYPNTYILVVSRQSEETYAERALRAGASGYLMKSESADELLRALDIVTLGENYVSPAIVSRALRHMMGESRRQRRRTDSLSDRELHVFKLIAQGCGVSEIAKELGISRKTVETHCEHIKRKLGYRDAQHLRHGARDALGEQP